MKYTKQEYKESMKRLIARGTITRSIGYDLWVKIQVSVNK